MIKTLGLILKKQNVGETDRIITIFSPTLGKKRVIARAVRKPTSKLAGHLDTFMVSQLMLTDQPDLPKVTSALMVESFESVRDSLVNLNRAFAISQIVERVALEDVSQQSIFQLTLDALVRLNDDHRWPVVWLSFLSNLTDHLGLDVRNFQCEKCAKPIRSAAYYLPSARVFYCQQCCSDRSGIFLEPNAVKLLYLLKNQTYSQLAKIALPLPVAQPLEELFLREITEWFTHPWLHYAALRKAGEQ